MKGDNGMEFLAKIGGRMRRYHIRVIPGDRVTIAVSPYDPDPRVDRLPRRLSPPDGAAAASVGGAAGAGAPSDRPTARCARFAVLVDPGPRRPAGAIAALRARLRHGLGTARPHHEQQEDACAAASGTARREAPTRKCGAARGVRSGGPGRARGRRGQRTVRSAGRPVRGAPRARPRPPTLLPSARLRRRDRLRFGQPRRGEASVGMRQSPRGDSDPPEPTFGASGTQSRLNWLAKKRRRKTSSQRRIVGDRVALLERGQRRARDAPRAEAEAQQVVEEEVVQLVGADEVFRALTDLAVRARPQQLGTDRRVEHVARARRRRRARRGRRRRPPSGSAPRSASSGRRR